MLTRLDCAASDRVCGTLNPAGLNCVSLPSNPDRKLATEIRNPPAAARTLNGRPPTVLWIDDEVRHDDASVRLLTEDGFCVECANSGFAGLNKIRTRIYDAILLDLRLPDMYGLSVLDRLTAGGRPVPVLVITGCYGELESERLARQLGAADFIRKPVSYEDLAAALRSIVHDSKLSVHAPERRSQFTQRPPIPSGTRGEHRIRPDFVAINPSMQAIVRWVDRVAGTNLPVLLTGETGTGKGLLARALHDRSNRRGQPFVPVNCGAIPENLVESELFGHRRGSFTGAFRDRAGLLEVGHGGTVFLDEIAEMTAPMQVRLLRFLDDGEVRRVGDSRIKRVDVRLVAATNRLLLEEVSRGRFRQDLYFRLAVARCHVPPLRERIEDVEALVADWLPQIGDRVVGISAGARALLREHPWPGNLRELRNVLEYAVCLATGNLLTEREISPALCRVPSTVSIAVTTPRNPDDLYRALTVLEENHWNHTRAAKELGISRKTLWRRLKRYGLGMPDDPHG